MKNILVYCSHAKFNGETGKSIFDRGNLRGPTLFNANLPPGNKAGYSDNMKGQ